MSEPIKTLTLEQLTECDYEIKLTIFIKKEHS